MIGVGVVGYGYWGPNLARCFAETEGCRLVAIADGDPAALARAGKRHPSATQYTHFDDLLADPAIDAVVIATPVHAHFALAQAALASGRHVLVEKPMTETAAQAETLIALAAQRGLTLMVDHTFVYTPAIQKIKELITTGELGDVYYYDSVRVNLGLFQSDVNVIWDLAVHDLAILQYVLDDRPATVSANGVCHVAGSPENMAHLTVYYESGTVAHLSVNWLAPVKVRQTLIGGSRKMIVYNELEPSEKIKVYDSGVVCAQADETVERMRVSYRTGDMWAPRIGVKEALLTEAEHFIACIRDGATPITDGRVGLSVVETLEAATQSMRRRGHPFQLSQILRAS
jgi:predicted dehydrogenase